MTMMRQHKAPLSRQIHEATAIETSKADLILNSKGEFNGARVPWITIEVGERVLTGNYRGSDPPPSDTNHDVPPPEELGTPQRPRDTTGTTESSKRRGPRDQVQPTTIKRLRTGDTPDNPGSHPPMIAQPGHPTLALTGVRPDVHCDSHSPTIAQPHHPLSCT